MIKSVLTPLVILSVAAYCTLFELRSIHTQIKLTNALETLQEYLKTSSFLSIEENQKRIAAIESELNSIHSNSALSNYELGKINLINGIKTQSSEKKFDLFCNARSFFLQALSRNPRDIDYNLALADIESISPYLASTCDSLTGANTQRFSVSERLHWVEHLAPFYPPSLYKKGIIEKSIGNRIAAMKSFRAFDERSSQSEENTRTYFIQEIRNEKELEAAVPEKYPNTVHWYATYVKLGSKDFDFKGIFEKKLILMLKALENDFNNQKIKGNVYTQILMDLHQADSFSSLQKFQSDVRAQLFKQTALQGNDPFQIEYFRRTSELQRINFAVSNAFSTLTKKSGKIYNWLEGNSTQLLLVDLQADGIGIYLPSNENKNFLVIQAQKNEFLPSDLKIELWNSAQNSQFNIVEPLEQKFTVGKINNIPTAYLELGRLSPGYYKLYFKHSSDRVYKISQTADTLIQLYN